MSAIMRIRLGVTGRKGHGFGSISLFLLSLTLLSVLGFWGGNGIHPKMAQAASGGDPVLLLAFTSEHCPACQVLEPLISGLESKNYPIRRVSPQNPDDLPYYQQYRIETMPSFVLLVDGKESDRFITNGEGIGVVQTRLLSMFQNA